MGEADEGDVLIPVYIVGFILGGLLCFAIAQRVPYRPVRICLRTIGVVAGPVFFLAVAIFSGWVREKTYEVEWQIGRPAEEYVGYDKSFAKTQEDIVVLKRKIGRDSVVLPANLDGQGLVNSWSNQTNFRIELENIPPDQMEDLIAAIRKVRGEN